MSLWFFYHWRSHYSSTPRHQTLEPITSSIWNKTFKRQDSGKSNSITKETFFIIALSSWWDIFQSWCLKYLWYDTRQLAYPFLSLLSSENNNQVNIKTDLSLATPPLHCRVILQFVLQTNPGTCYSLLVTRYCIISFNLYSWQVAVVDGIFR